MTLQKSKKLPILKRNTGECRKNFPNNLSKIFYQKILTYDLVLKNNYTSIMQLPRLEKIILNTTSKSYVQDKKALVFTLAALEFISGQKPQLTYAKKSIANFKIRQHQILGCKVVLKENLMYPFLEKLSRIILPRLAAKKVKKRNFFTFLARDYPQKNKNFLAKSPHYLNPSSISRKTGRNKGFQPAKFLAYTLGLKNVMIFPELESHFELVEDLRGLTLTFVFSTGYHKKSFNKLNTPNPKSNEILNSKIIENELLLLLSGFQIPCY